MQSGAPKMENPLIEAIKRTTKINDKEQVYSALNACSKHGQIDADVKSLSGLTPLQFAAQCGNRWAVVWLLDSSQHPHYDPNPNSLYLEQVSNEVKVNLYYALTFAVSHADDGIEIAKAESKGDSKEAIPPDSGKLARRAIIDLLCEVHTLPKNSPPPDFDENVFDAALRNKNFYYLKHYLCNNYGLLPSGSDIQASSKLKRFPLDENQILQLRDLGIDEKNANFLLHCIIFHPPSRHEIKANSLYKCFDQQFEQGVTIFLQYRLHEKYPLGLAENNINKPFISYLLGLWKNHKIEQRAAAEMILFLSRFPLVIDDFAVLSRFEEPYQTQLFTALTQHDYSTQRNIYFYSSTTHESSVLKLIEYILRHANPANFLLFKNILIKTIRDMRGKPSSDTINVDKNFLFIQGVKYCSLPNQCHFNIFDILSRLLFEAAQNNDFELVKKCLAANYKISIPEEFCGSKSSLDPRIKNYLLLHSYICICEKNFNTLKVSMGYPLASITSFLPLMEGLIKIMPEGDVRHLLSVYLKSYEFNTIIRTLTAILEKNLEEKRKESSQVGPGDEKSKGNAESPIIPPVYSSSRVDSLLIQDAQMQSESKQPGDLKSTGSILLAIQSPPSVALASTTVAPQPIVYSSRQIQDLAAWGLTVAPIDAFFPDKTTQTNMLSHWSRLVKENQPSTVIEVAVSENAIPTSLSKTAGS